MTWITLPVLFDVLESSKVYFLTSSDNCALSMLPADKRMEKERERKRLEPTVCGRIVGILRILSFNHPTSEIKQKQYHLSQKSLNDNLIVVNDSQRLHSWILQSVKWGLIPRKSMTRLKSDAWQKPDRSCLSLKLNLCYF